jgi:hypothetical protein
LSFLLDTNVVSEPTRPRPELRVLRWLAQRRPDEVFVSAATVAEVRYGIEAIQDGARKRALERWYAETFEGRPERVIPVTLDVADAWGRVRRRAEMAKRTMSVVDTIIAATAEVRGLVVATRNVRDFEVWGGPVFDPWREG